MKAMMIGLLAATQPRVLEAAIPIDPVQVEQVRGSEAAFWDAFNTCDLARISASLAVDAEFYHDITGLTVGRGKVADSLARGPCGDPKLRIRRVPDGEIELHPLADQAVVVIGAHDFYAVANGRERLATKARFIDLWQRDTDGVWRLRRIVSYDHRIQPYAATDTEVGLDRAVLLQHTGRYRSQKAGPVEIVAEDGHLVLIAGSFRLPVYASSPSTFFAKDRDLQLRFVDAGVEPAGFEIVEAGEVSDRSVRLP